MPHEHFPSARPKWFTPTTTPCALRNGTYHPLENPKVQPRRFAFVPSQEVEWNANSFWTEVIDFRSRRDEILIQASRSPVHLVIDHYQHAEWIGSILSDSSSRYIGVWIQVSTPDSFGGMRAGNDAVDLAHGAIRFFLTQFDSPIVLGFVTTIEPGIPSRLEPARIAERDQRLLEHTLKWASSEGHALRAFRELPTVSESTTPHPHQVGTLVATVVSRPSLEVGLINIGSTHGLIPSRIQFPDHSDITISRMGSIRCELHLERNSQNLRIGDQVRLEMR